MNTSTIIDVKYSSVFNNSEVPQKYKLVLNAVDRGKRVLELGCYDGFFSRKLIDNNNYVVGVDHDSNSLELASSFCQEVYLCDLNKPDKLLSHAIHGQQFDFILLMDVLEHLIAPEELLLKLKPFLKNDGRMIISLPNIAYWAIRLMLLRGRFEYSDMGILDKTHLRFFTFNTACDLLQKSGFSIIQWEPLNYYVPFLGILGLRKSSLTKSLTRNAEYRLAQKCPNIFSSQWYFLVACTA